MKPKHLAVGAIVGALLLNIVATVQNTVGAPVPRKRVIVTSDGEIDDMCSMVRFLLYTNDWDVEAIVTSSSQYHWRGHKWSGDDWLAPLLDAYAKVWPNLVRHDRRYPSPDLLKKRTLLGNVDAEGEMEKDTPGARRIAQVMLDERDRRPVWVQAWGGTNTIARALRSIELEHPEKMASVARKLRFFLIWEQDATYQSYIRPVWGRFGIPTIISDQFEAIAYRWKMVQPNEMKPYFGADWMKRNILENHGPLAALYQAHVEGDAGFEPGDFRSEGDSPAFLNIIENGLRADESPDWGGWGGRYLRVRENTWLDPVPVAGFKYPEGRWFTETAWGRNSLRDGSTTTEAGRREYFRPMWMWSAAMQNDFAARADWCVLPYAMANHPPRVILKGRLDRVAKPGDTVRLDASGTNDPDRGDKLTFNWRQLRDAGSYKGGIAVESASGGRAAASFKVPADARAGETIHVLLEVTDSGTPPLARYRRVVVTVK